MGIEKFNDPIEEISNRAENQNKIKTNIKKIQELWKSKEMTIISIKDGEMWVLTKMDDVTGLLDDKINEIQTMKNSADVTPKLRQMCDSLEHALSDFNQVIEEWVKFQKSWLELEPIFRSDDITKQLPNEAKDFDRHNKNYKQFMKDGREDPKCSTFINCASDHLTTFIHGNKVLEGIQKKMNN